MNKSDPDSGIPPGTSRISRFGLLLMSLGSTVIYITLTLILLYFFHDAPLVSLFAHGFSLHLQLIIGVAFGLLSAGLLSWFMFFTPMSDILRDYSIVNMISEMHFSRFDKVQVSFFAGAGEELLFRGALQPLLGIWITSLLFVGIHGYFKFTSIKHMLFGVVMFGLSVGLGLLFEWAGLVAAMSAHAVYDYVMLHTGAKYAFGKRSDTLQETMD